MGKSIKIRNGRPNQPEPKQTQNATHAIEQEDGNQEIHTKINDDGNYIRQMEDGVDVQAMLDEAINLPDLNIAVSGLAGRFPKSDSINEFEKNLRDGIDMINDEDNARFTCRLWGLPPRAGRLKDLSRFDAQFFGYSKDEANYIDYQMRLLYEVVYESIMDAGLNPASLRGSNTGVFFGFHCNEFENAMVDDPGFKSNGYYGQFATRIAQYFDFRGMTVTFDAACASGFVGLHHGVEAIRTGQCDQVIVCSANIPIHPTGSFIFLQMQMLSPTGYSRFMDSRADGYVKSEACVSVLLQQKDLALRNYANVVATMTSVDGFKREGITFPSDKSQELLIKATKDLAGISTNHVEYLEAHGTGTPAGDPQEAKAIANVYNRSKQKLEDETTNSSGQQRKNDNDDDSDERKIGPLLLGSVKTNMGHSEAASGLCALTKVALMLENELIYPSLHFSEPNANIESLKDGRIQFVGDKRPLRGKIIPLSCYGFGGSNVHAIMKANELEAIPEGYATNEHDNNNLPRLILMFGRGERELDHFFDRMLDRDDYQTKNCLSDDFLVLIDSLNSSKIDRLMNYRGYMIVDRKNNCQLHRSIERCELPSLNGLQNVDGRKNHFQEAKECKINLIFPGLSSSYDAMAAGLTKFGSFWSTIEGLGKILEAFEPGQPDLNAILTGQKRTNSLTLSEKFCSIIAYEVALVNCLVKKDGLNITKINSIVGHSLGEIAAAYVAGLFDEREAIVVAYRIGKTLDENLDLISGRMIAVEMSELEAAKLINECHDDELKSVAISCINGPQSVTLSGSQQDMHSFCKMLDERNIHYILVEKSVALHNKNIMTDEIRVKLRSSLLKVLHPLTQYDRSKTTWISTCSPSMENNLDYSNANADYFARAMCEKVDFGNALNQLQSHSICVELGPSGIFESQFVLLRNTKDFRYFKLMKRDTKPEDQFISLLKCLGALYQSGLNNMSLRNIYPSMKTISRVRRRTPSLSSIFNWHHEDEFFVPRYPLQFSKSSAKCEMPIDIMQERDKYVLGHCVEGRCLFPATGYLFLIWRVFSFTQRKIYDACFQDVEQDMVPIEFHQVRLSRAVILMNNRVAQLYVHLEESTGRFEIKEGGSVVVEGWVRSPIENPSGMLYEGVRERIEKENLTAEMVKEDIYKQFRVSGYDYGETFQNIVEASGDGRYCRVKFNGHFVALTDSILQSIFLAISQYAPSGGLFLPTRFDYVRFQPEIILAKLHEAGMKLDRSDGSLNTMEKREIMTKIMQREGGVVDLNKQQTENEPEGELATDEEPSKTSSDVASGGDEKEAEKSCFFDTYCDPVTGIIITDGIEMRGIKASPAPRKMDTKDVLLESYQFVPDKEEPILDDKLSGFQTGFQAQYKQVCDRMAFKLVKQISNRSDELIAGSLDAATTKVVNDEQVELFKETHLKSSFAKLTKPQNLAQKANESESTEDESAEEKEMEPYDIKKNGNLSLLSVLEQLECYGEKLSHTKIEEILGKYRLHLMNDLLNNSFVCERLMRPIVECVLENSCQRKSKLSLLEINEDDGLLREPMNQLVKSIEPTFTLEYLLAHPEPSRVSSLAPANEVKTHVLKDIGALLADQRLRDLDLIVYKDLSCYQMLIGSELKQEHETISPLAEGVKRGGFLLVLMRSKLTLTENLLMAMRDSDTIGMTDEQLQDRIRSINNNLERRKQQLYSVAIEKKLILISSKSDLNGCSAILFKRPDNRKAKTNLDTRPEVEHVLLRITHKDQENIEDWLSRLKNTFKIQEANDKSTSDNNNPSQSAESQAEKQEPMQEEVKPEKEKIIWLCAIDTKQECASGVIGMVQALRKELGSSRLRCFYDQHTFAQYDREVNELSLDQIEQSSNFKRAFERDLIWNCVDKEGRLGSYRHFTINQYLSYENCLCDVQKQGEQTVQSNTANSVAACYVNNAARGDLSSFSWFEAPFKYLDSNDRQKLVHVCYSALNFRDIMLATGRLPLDAIPLKLAMSDCHMGLEFAGFELETGKRVMGMIPARGIATQVYCDPMSSIKIDIPDGMDMREAATIPVVYATAVLALIYRGKMQLGESILIHAGSGGVGQAAIRLALHFGLKVFTTVGSDEKRKFLLQEFGGAGIKNNFLREDHIFSSRDTVFEREILLKTQGRGVDLVLNSLADDKLQASVRCLADGGRFLEIGKYDMSIDARFELLNLDHNKTFHGILLDKLFDMDDNNQSFRNQLKCVMETMRQGFEEGFIKPIRYTMFKRDQIEEAFRFMASGKHIGKILIEIQAAIGSKGERAPDCLTSLKSIPRFQMNPVASHIVTGGLGGFGLELIKWLVGQGARNFLITSRAGVRTGYQKITLKRLESQGVKFNIVTYDTTTREGVSQLLEEALEQSTSRQIGSIFHLAMVLKDNLLENMTSEDFQLVCKPKITTCEFLDKILLEKQIQLDHFVCFSSVTSGKGNAGQANYAYANSFIERICERRRARGEHGLAIQWGAIGDVGAAFENLGGNNVVVGGTVPQRMPSCQATLGKLLCCPFAVCLSVVPVNRGGDASALGTKGDLVGSILHVLGIKDSSKVSEEATLGELGLDSLMAVEIRQYIEREYDVTMNMQEIRALTIAKIREIGEKGAGKKVTVNNDDNSGQGSDPAKADSKEIAGINEKPVIVSSYGTKLDNQLKQEGSQIIKELESATDKASELVQTNGLPMLKLEDNIKFDINVIGGFKPELCLPRHRFRRLNDVPLFRDGDARDAACRPFFFLPPIHGSFELLEPISKLLDRPCIGLNWSKAQARAKTISEAVDSYLKNLEFWFRRRSVQGGEERVVDLIGYSFGATVAFELMVKLHNNYYSTKDDGESHLQLKPGRLILLDGSPKQIELSSKLIDIMNRKGQLNRTEKLDELLMAYVVSHTKHLLITKRLDFLELQSRLRAIQGEEDKVRLASEFLSQLLDSTTISAAESAPTSPRPARSASSVQSSSPLPSLSPSPEPAESLGPSSDLSDSGAASDTTRSDDDEYEENVETDGEEGENNSIDDLRTEIQIAIEAFLRRYDIVDKYKCSSKFPDKSILIRAEEVYLKKSMTGKPEGFSHPGSIDTDDPTKTRIDQKKGRDDDDLGLSSIVKDVELHIMSGNHQTFLDINRTKIAKIINST